VRLSSGEAGLDLSFAIPFLWAGLHFYVAAPEDGRTPALSLIPLSSQYLNLPTANGRQWTRTFTKLRIYGLAFVPRLEQPFLPVEPRLLVWSFGELRSKPPLQFHRQRAIPIQRRLSGVGYGTEVQPFGQRPRNIAM
jgi:hypothetical protein